MSFNSNLLLLVRHLLLLAWHLLLVVTRSFKEKLQLPSKSNGLPCRPTVFRFCFVLLPEHVPSHSESPSSATATMVLHAQYEVSALSRCRRLWQHCCVAWHKRQTIVTKPLELDRVLQVLPTRTHGHLLERFRRLETETRRDAPQCDVRRRRVVSLEAFCLSKPRSLSWTSAEFVNMFLWTSVLECFRYLRDASFGAMRLKVSRVRVSSSATNVSCKERWRLKNTCSFLQTEVCTRFFHFLCMPS